MESRRFNHFYCFKDGDHSSSWWLHVRYHGFYSIFIFCVGLSSYLLMRFPLAWPIVAVCQSVDVANACYTHVKFF